jgi:predicted metalloprotease
MACRDDFTTETFAYCPGDQIVYVGDEALWTLYSIFGDAAAVAGLVHEYGHHLQWNVGISNPLEDPSLQVQEENQADCVAGAFIGWARAQGTLNESDDIGDLVSLVQAIADAEDDPNREHGTINERAAAFDRGIDNDIYACVEFFPDKPIIVAP